MQVAKMFNNIAPYYDFLNHFLSIGIDRKWRKTALLQLKKHQPRFMLDVATGTADVAIETIRLLGPVKVVGVDISKEMLEVGRKKVRRFGMERLIELKEGDSENLPFPNNTFDAITVAFGVRNFENLEGGLQEMRRVLKKGGKLVVLEFSKPKMFPFKHLFNFYFKNVLPIIGRITSRDPKAYSYLYQSVQAFPDGDDFIKVLEKTAFKYEFHRPLTMGICSIYVAEK